MRYREFGNTGMKVSEIGFGAWAIGGNAHGNSYGHTDDRVSLEAVLRALDLGCNFFDTADVYGFGHSEEILGKVTRHNRDRMILASKVGADFYSGAAQQCFEPAYIRTALEKSLERLDTDYLDIYQLHNPPLKLIERLETYSVLLDLKREGKIRAWGISIFDPVEGLTALKIAQPDCLQVVYNIFSPKAAQELFPRAAQKNCAIIAREPLANGFLTGKYRHDSKFTAGDIRNYWPHDYIAARAQAAASLLPLLKGRSLAQLSLQFALSPKAVSTVIAGIKTPEQCQENLQASDLEDLDTQTLAAIAELGRHNFGLA
jgi:aryl-alcohol dehydrogenase-like predicted oxidoreductase